jgi:hypothetical protein
MDLLAAPMKEADMQIRNEQSRTVKIFLMKYKCILILTFMILALGQMIYIILNKLISDDRFMTQLFTLLQSRNGGGNITGKCSSMFKGNSRSIFRKQNFFKQYSCL